MIISTVREEKKSQKTTVFLLFYLICEFTRECGFCIFTYHMDRQGQRHGLSEIPHAHLNYEQYGNSE